MLRENEMASSFKIWVQQEIAISVFLGKPYNHKNRQLPNFHIVTPDIPGIFSIRSYLT